MYTGSLYSRGPLSETFSALLPHNLASTPQMAGIVVFPFLQSPEKGAVGNERSLIYEIPMEGSER